MLIVKFGGNALALLRGDARGSLAWPAIDVARTGIAPRSVALADFNGDGHLDAAVANSYAPYPDQIAISVFPGTGSGTFLPPSDYLVNGTPNAIVAADLNGDGNPDLAVATYYRDSVEILLNNGSGGLCVADHVGPLAQPLLQADDPAIVVEG